MSSATPGELGLAYAQSSRRRGGLRVDTTTLALVLAILLYGLVMVTSASISIASRETGHGFFYLDRQFATALAGGAAAAVLLAVPTARIQRLSMPLLIAALVLLLLVLVPGLGRVVNGSRRWLDVAGINVQVSEPARMFILIYVASYAVRREEALRGSFVGLLKPVALLACASALLIAEPDFGAATVLFATGFGILFLAGARLRHVLAIVIIASAAFALLAVTSAYRLRRLTVFFHPWADPFNSGFQLTQSLIAIGRGGWLGVGLGDSVQKLFYLPEAQTDFLFAVLAEEFGLVGAVVTLSLFLALVWRSFRIARLAADQGLAFAAYVASGFGLWLGIQAFINIGVNMGVLPTKGLTLPLMSYGRSSLVVALAWVGLVLRAYHEASGAMRGSATARGPTQARDT
ncbi:MAG: putative lipid II flippase FtsW [Steroidobacteraceae bacterium]